MSYFNKYMLRPIVGMLTKTGADIGAMYKVPNPFSLHNFSTGNSVFRRQAGYLSNNGIKYHRSRATIRY